MMGRLRPGAEYDYDHVGENIYAVDRDTGERFLIGSYDKHQKFIHEADEDALLKQLLEEIRMLAKNDERIRLELERLVAYYTLIKEEQQFNPPQWHPV